jgi:hypothetical protein
MIPRARLVKIGLTLCSLTKRKLKGKMSWERHKTIIANFYLPIDLSMMVSAFDIV